MSQVQNDMKIPLEGTKQKKDETPFLYGER